MEESKGQIKSRLELLEERSLKDAYETLEMLEKFNNAPKNGFPHTMNSESAKVSLLKNMYQDYYLLACTNF